MAGVPKRLRNMGKGKYRPSRIKPPTITPDVPERTTPKKVKAKLANLFRSSFYYKKWSRIYKVQKDRRSGMTWQQVMERHGITKPTMSRHLKQNVPQDIKDAMDNPGAPKTYTGIKKQADAKSKLNANFNPVQFMEDPESLNMPLFPMQRLIVKAFYGMPLDNKLQHEAFKGLTEQAMMDKLVKEGKCTWKGHKVYRELVLVVGMKAGKTALGGAMSCYEEYCLYRLDDCRKQYGLPEGKQILILNVAANEDQAKKTVFAETEARVRTAPYYLNRPAPAINANSIFFEAENILMQSGHSNSDALVGPLSKAVFLDELDRFKSKASGKASGDKMYSSISRNVTPFLQDGKIVSMSSSMMENGPIIRLFNMSKGEPSMLGFRLATWEMNPNLPFECETLQIELRKSPEDFWRDYGARPAHSIEKYYRDRTKIDRVFERAAIHNFRNPIRPDGTFEEWFRGNAEFQYHMHFDPSAKNDVFGFGMSHRDGPHVFADLVHEFKAPEGGEIDYAQVREFVMRVIERFPTVVSATYDVYLAIELMQSLREKGIEAHFLRIDKKEHDTLKIETVYNDRLVCYPNNRLRIELRSLELLNGRKVDHPAQNEDGTKGSKDIADALAGSVVGFVAEGEFNSVPAACGGGEDQSLQQDAGEQRSSIFGRQPGSVFRNIEGAGGFSDDGGPGSRRGGLIW